MLVSPSLEGGGDSSDGEPSRPTRPYTARRRERSIAGRGGLDATVPLGHRRRRRRPSRGPESTTTGTLTFVARSRPFSVWFLSFDACARRSHPRFITGHGASKSWHHYVESMPAVAVWYRLLRPMCPRTTPGGDARVARAEADTSMRRVRRLGAGRLQVQNPVFPMRIWGGISYRPRTVRVRSPGPMVVVVRRRSQRAPGPGQDAPDAGWELCVELGSSKAAARAANAAAGSSGVRRRRLGRMPISAHEERLVQGAALVQADLHAVELIAWDGGRGLVVVDLAQIDRRRRWTSWYSASWVPH
jgi:hypothetical protein